jgi:beta-hydroxylase
MGSKNSKKSKRSRRRQLEIARVTRRPGESALSHRLRVLARASALRVGKEIRPAINRVLGRHSKIGARPWLDPDRFDWVPSLEASWEAIRKEAEVVLQARSQLPPLHEISPDHSRIDTADDKWKVYFLKGYGFWVDEHCRQCPATTEAVRRIPGVESAFFSILEAGKHIPRHRGPTRAIFTCHLGLLLPSEPEKCWIEVARIRRRWEVGKTLIFDDTYKHEVLNDTGEDRVVLLLHVRRPLRFPVSLLGRAVFGAIRWSPFVQDGLRNQRRWEERLARAEEHRRAA